MKRGSLVSFIIVVVFLLGLTHVANAAGPDGYGYNKTDTIQGSPDGSLPNYPVMLVVHGGSGADGGRDVYLSGHSRSWPNDIRFTDSNGTICPYWIESYDADTARIWVLIPGIPASPGTATLTMYYGKPGDAGASDGADTFLFFDDFKGMDTGKWSTGTNGSGLCSISGGALQVSSGTHAGSYGCVTTLGSYPVNNVAVGAKYRGCLTSRGYNGANFACTATRNFEPVLDNTWELQSCSYTWADTSDDNCYALYVQGRPAYHDGIVRPTAWGDWITSEVRTTGSGISAFENGVRVYYGTFGRFNSSRYRISADGQDPNNYGSQYTQVDYVYIRNYTPNEPVPGAWGRETAAQPSAQSSVRPSAQPSVHSSVHPSAQPPAHSSSSDGLIIVAIVVMIAAIAILTLVLAIMVGYMMVRQKNK